MFKGFLERDLYVNAEKYSKALHCSHFKTVTRHHISVLKTFEINKKETKVNTKKSNLLQNKNFSILIH
ncbi:CLUMA_CG019259, isoform A [Clunio marinus]|uniref:CLUMA_CG019259, isoform A n=1 Tax=Clunio marinus TaxID=568069 RepID=A0A1J1J167_9DIPT|nr:CLUMA_CG019259, isoform A [Clunio marinus]